MNDSTGEPLDPFAGVVGNAGVVDQLRRAAPSPLHAYLLVGSRGAGGRAHAMAFAAAVLAAGLEAQAADRVVRLALEGEHADLTVVERRGAAISTEQADEVVRVARLRPVEGTHKVIVLDELHLMDERVAPKLLKTIEEPPPGTVFVVLAEHITPELATIASRCVRLELGAVTHDELVTALVAGGASAEEAEQAARLAGGDLGRARLLVGDPAAEARRSAWRSLPDRLDGTGSAAVVAVDELLTRIDEAQLPLDERHRVELEDAQRRAEDFGERGSGRRELEARHRREVRRHRTDELRVGLGELARRCRDEAAAASDPRPWITAQDEIGQVLDSLGRNANERVALLAMAVSRPAS